jgi:uncharacterized protein
MVSEVEFRGEDGTRLAASLVVPEGAVRVPAALILSGSGPLDRNSNMAGQALNVANALTDVLTEQGVATLRYDKRGVGGSEGDYLVTGFDTETSDAASALAWLGDRAEIDGSRLAVWGTPSARQSQSGCRARARRSPASSSSRGPPGRAMRSCNASPTGSPRRSPDSSG